MIAAPYVKQGNAGPCIGGPWHGKGLNHFGTVRPIAGVAAGDRVGQIVGSYVWHAATREWRWLAIGVPYS